MITKAKRASLPYRSASLTLLLALSPLSHALPLYADDETTIDAKLAAAFGAYYSRENYAQSGTLSEGSSNWQESMFQYGLDIKHANKDFGTTYGALNWVSTGTYGDGDSAGWSDGTERTTKIEDAYIGWRSTDLVPAFGTDGIDFSFGRQTVVIGDGFLMSGDALNFGNGIDDGHLNRGGAYYLTARKDFDRTAILRLGGKQGWRSDLMWLKSDNPAQAKPELAVGTLEHVAEQGTVGLTYIKVLDTDKALAEQLYPERKGMKQYSIRAQGNAGVPNLFLSSEYAWEHTDTRQENAWYMEAGWTFSELPMKPVVNYRYSRFSEGYDPMFYGNGRALGTWFQGEVASNYAGPFNTNTQVHHVGIKAAASPTVNVGALLYDFSSLNSSVQNLGAREADLYAEWTINQHFMLMPLVGLYKPEHSTESGGTQLGNSNTNLYAQVILGVNF
ncbi:hypothetical protein [Pseudomonas sp. TH41]|uniref:hypothetical protein n=1 Tax=Pseudomonas sp. TH41 TaxID=2796405 RepID=UPI00313B84DA